MNEKERRERVEKEREGERVFAPGLRPRERETIVKYRVHNSRYKLTKLTIKVREKLSHTVMNIL